MTDHNSFIHSIANKLFGIFPVSKIKFFFPINSYFFKKKKLNVHQRCKNSIMNPSPKLTFYHLASYICVHAISFPILKSVGYRKIFA